MLTSAAKISMSHFRGGFCMKGTVCYRSDRNFWFVRWGNHKISHYKGFLCRDGEISGMKGQDMARRLLSVIQGDSDSCSRLGIPFSINKYLDAKVDTIPYLREWLENKKSMISPATYKDYHNSIENHLVPWLKDNPYRIHELKYDILVKLLNAINRTGKGRKNVMYCLRACLDYAAKSEHILAVPPFPENRLYGIGEKKRKGISSDRQERILNCIPDIHKPIFYWLKMHYRRPSEACALHKTDYDKGTDSFMIQRTFSNKILVEHTKTHKDHHIPCNPKFKPIMDSMPTSFGKFFFENSSPFCKTKDDGRHYTVTGLEDIWNVACEKAGEKISLYPGTKHSACWQFLNEQGGTIDELQSLTDHARRDSVKVYSDMELERKRQLMGKVLNMNSAPKSPQAINDKHK